MHVWLKWGFDALVDGHHSACRHDASPFLPKDPRRAQLAGTCFGGSVVVKGATVLVKGDLKELSTTWALLDISSHSAMCPCCHHEGTEHLEHDGFSSTNTPSASKTHVDMVAAASSCEVRTPLLQWDAFLEMRASLIPYLEIDGPRGRAPSIALPAIGLLLKDRLEPTEQLPDVYAIDQLKESDYTPQSFLFWRRNAETLARHRSPLWDDRLGLTLDRCLTMDFLHNFSKGIFHFLR